MKEDFNSIRELESILRIEGLRTKGDGMRARLKAFEEWKKKYIKEVNVEQSIIKSTLTSSDLDFIIYHLGSEIGKDIVEECSRLTIKPDILKLETLLIKK